MHAKGRRGWILAGLTAAVLTALPAQAAAITRYAAPGGTADPTACQSPSGPFCSIGTAAGGTGVVGGDEAVILPGTYSAVGGDLDGDAGSVPGVAEVAAGSVHGASGQSRPVIVLDSTAPSPNHNPYGAFFIGSGSLSDVEIDTGPGSTATANFTVVGNTTVVDRVIARSAVDNAVVCNQSQGTVRDTACLSSGSGAAAIGASTFIGGTFTVNVRNVTAIATGAGSSGAFYFYATASPPVGPTITISAKSMIAQGAAQDVRVRASQTGTSVTMNLDHSNYDTAIDEDLLGGTASVTAPGTGAPNFNVTASPLLGTDGYHQLAGSPTINAGATDGSSGSNDIDGQARQIGLFPADIGADESGIGSATAVACTPTSVTVGESATCTATVTAAAEFINGTVSFSSDTAGGSFSGTGSCTLPSAMTSTQCQLTYTATQSGSHGITGSYSGDANHDGSGAATALTVSSISQGPGVGPAGAPGSSPVRKKCKKKKAKKGAAAAKKKCKKKKRK
jgi:Big-like domain-containing protein